MKRLMIVLAFVVAASALALGQGGNVEQSLKAMTEQVDQAYAHSDQARIIERFHLTKDAKGIRVLVDEMTLTDPVFYTKPVAIMKKWALSANGHVISYNCTLPDWERFLDELRAKASTRPGEQRK